MRKKHWINPRVRRSAAVSAVLIAAIAAVSIFAQCSGGQEVNSRAILNARRVWADAAIKNYNLEWTAAGSNPAHYFVTVRGGEVRKVESVAHDGKRSDLHPAESRFYGVDGLFTTIADELVQLDSEKPFGQPKGTKVVMKFDPDPKLGYPRSYRRDVLGTSQSLAIEVIRLEPVEAGDSAPKAEANANPQADRRQRLVGSSRGILAAESSRGTQRNRLGRE